MTAVRRVSEAGPTCVLPGVGARPAALPASRSDARALARQKPRQGSQHRPVGPGQSRVPDLSTQNLDLMPESEYLDTVRRVVTGKECEPGEDLEEEPEDQFHDHGHQARGTDRPIPQTGRSLVGRPFWRVEGFWAAADGDQSVNLNGGSAGALAQTFATTPGTRYKVTYSMAGNPAGGPVIKTGCVPVNGLDAQDFSFELEFARHSTANSCRTLRICASFDACERASSVSQDTTPPTADRAAIRPRTQSLSASRSAAVDHNIFAAGRRARDPRLRHSCGAHRWPTGLVEARVDSNANAWSEHAHHHRRR